MDYTTLGNAKSILDAIGTSDDVLLARMITEASRAADRHCAGFVNYSDNYFQIETITDDSRKGLLDRDGNILVYARKPLVSSVSGFSYRYNPLSPWLDVPLSQITFDGYVIKAWIGLLASTRGRIETKVSYAGGLASSISGLPNDIINAVDLLSVRMYRESKTGVTDSIGVAELGTLQYTKALPVRFVELLSPWQRKFA